jgi:hypothetical protein
MPKILLARPPQDEQEERRVYKLATGRHGPAELLWSMGVDLRKRGCMGLMPGP